MKVDHFTYTDLAKAGPLFHPESSMRSMAQQAMRYRKQAIVVLAKRDEILSELTQAQLHLGLRQRMLRHARIDAGMNKSLARSLPRMTLHPAWRSPTFEADTKQIIKDCGVELGHALDRLWSAQRAVAMWDHVYGDLL